MRKSGFGISLLVAMAACGGLKQESNQTELLGEEAVLLAINKGPCFGKCPVYTYQITTNGQVYYQGKDFAEPSGFHQFRLDKKTIQWLEAQIKAAQLLGLSDEYLCNIADATTTTISALSAGVSKTIIYRCNDEIKQVLELERKTDSLIFNRLLSQ